MSHLPENGMAGECVSSSDQRVLQRLVEIYQRWLSEHRVPQEFLRERGIGDTRLSTQHQIGYSDGSLKKLLPNSGPILDTLRELGVWLPDGQERFKGRIVVPIHDQEGGLVNLWGIGFTARLLAPCEQLWIGYRAGAQAVFLDDQGQ